MYKVILVPLDGSKRSESVLPHVESLARSYGAKIVLLTVNEHSFGIGMEGGLIESVVQQQSEETEKWSKSYLEGLTRDFHTKDLKCEYRVEYGRPVETILYIANDVKADLVAMASHGRGGLARVFYGSVASGIVNRIDRPLLVIRSRNI
ncbi:MAG: universal stress protein [Pseudomonadota bacterium]